MNDTLLTMNWRSATLGLVMACTTLALLYLVARRIERRAVGWLVAFVAAGMISAVPMVIGFAGAYDRWPGLTFLPTQLALLFGPLIVLHARTLMLNEPLGRWRWLLMPGLVYWLYQLWAFTALGDYRAKWAFNDAVHEPYVVPTVLMGSLVLTFWGLTEVWRLRRRYLGWLADNRSDDDAFEPVWLTHLVLIGTPLAVIWAIDSLLGLAFDLSYFDRYWSDMVTLFLLFFITVEALARLQGPYPKMDALAEPPSAPSPEPAARDWSEEGGRLQAAIVDNQWHLEPDLSLQTLSRRFGMNQAYVSRALNQGLGERFSHLINGLRVDHAKALIDEGALNLLDIALASGFGSKASFNRAFKEHSGLTPSAYRRQAVTAHADAA
ncbi:MAG: AraC family transcriptional regulator [Pseudomonadota bacterium]